MKLASIKAGKGFAYSDEPQGSPEWVTLRVGKVTASRLKDWMAVGVKGQPLKARGDYEREIAYERQFKVPFSRFVTSAMEQGIVAEKFVKDQYSSIVGDPIVPCGAFYNDKFVASPDGVIGDDGLAEVKWLWDNAFADVLENGVPYEYQLQIQGQLLASGRKWCDFIAGNGNTGKFKVIRVYPDEELQKRIIESLEEVENIKHEFDTDGVFSFTSEPAAELIESEW